MFLDSKADSCIVFEIHLRVDAPQESPGGKPMQLGKVRAWQEVKEGTIHGESMTNVRTAFSSKQSNQTKDGEILLVAPASKVKEAKRLYEVFLRSVSFGPK
jgi:hypothetical protein